MSAQMKMARMNGSYGSGRARAMGDPGLFGRLAGAVGGFLTGGPAGAIAGFAAPGTGRQAPPQPAAYPVYSSSLGRYVTPAGTSASQWGIANPQQRGSFKLNLNPMFGGAPGMGFTAPGIGRLSIGESASMPATGMQPKGYHANKSSYWLNDGTYVPKGSRWVKNRHRNPLNPRALRRAVGRIDAGKIWQSKLREVETSKFTKAGNRK